jgi:Mitochondrial carrier protein
MQLQGEGGAALKYKSSLQAFPQIVAEEGIFALYKGIQPALLRQATYGSLRIGMYEPVKGYINSFVSNVSPSSSSATPSPSSPNMLVKLLAGLFTGALASGICNPTDVVKVRMQADGMKRGPDGSLLPPRYKNVFDAFKNIYTTEGLKGLYKGVSPTMQRAAVVAGVELATYDECKTFLISYLRFSESSVVTHFGASILAGFFCTVASSPLDVIKSRVMNQPVDANGNGLLYKSTIDAFRKAIAKEGFASLYNGFWPNFSRIGPHCIITFMTIEQLRSFFSKKPANSEK